MAIRHALRDAEGTAKMSQRLELQTLNPSDREWWGAETDTLFILGSGPSIEDITASQWQHIAQHTSIGLNSWVIHDFIPDFYGCEEVESLEYIEVQTTISAMLRREDVTAKRPGVLLLRPQSRTEGNRIIDIPSPLRGRSRIYGRTTAVTRKTTNLVSDLEKLLGSYQRGKIPSPILIDAGMSIARMVSLGVVSGFTKIVLLGVDLNSNTYFFDQNPGYFERRGIDTFNPWKHRGQAHDTQDRTTRHFIATEFLPALASAAKNTHGVDVFLSSTHSALANDLPQYPWQ